MATCLVALGSNLGDSRSILQQAIERLDADPAIAVVQRSRWIATAPVGGPADQPDFINGAIRLETSLSPERLHSRLVHVETQLGRRRRLRWAARKIDLDLLLYDQHVLNSPRLTLPHPRMAFRRFVLEPAAEVGRELVHPHIGWTVARLRDHLRYAANYLALTGPPGSGKTALAQQVAHATSWRWLPDPAARLPPDAPENLNLERRAAVLKKAVWKSTDRAVSDFWIGQSLVRQLARGQEAAEAFSSHWTSVAEQTVAPKLLVLLTPRRVDAPASGSSDGSNPACFPRVPEGAAAQLPPEKVVWQNVVRWYYEGPSLQLDAAQPEVALAELTAAVQAMT